MLTREILGAIPKPAPTVIRWGTVAQTSPLLVKFPGDASSVSVLKLAGYTPTLNAQCALIKIGSRWVAIGEFS